MEIKIDYMVISKRNPPNHDTGHVTWHHDKPEALSLYHGLKDGGVYLYQRTTVNGQETIVLLTEK